MSWLHYIDNEVPWSGDYGEWDARTQAGSSVISRGTNGSFPERGSHGLRAMVVDGDAAYAQKDLTAQSPLAFGFWFKIPSEPTWSSGNYFLIAHGCNTSTGRDSFYLGLKNTLGDARLRIWVYAGAASSGQDDTLNLTAGRWYYIGLVGTWTGSQAQLKLYVDGAYRCTATKAGDATDNLPNRFELGNTFASGSPSGTLDFDEIKIATSYPEPYVPGSSSDYPCPERVCVLFRQADSDSEEFADYCVSQLGVPRSNLIALPNASGTEHLVAYTSFQNEVEDDIADWFTRNPTVEAQCMCFLLGHGVPGYFYDSGDLYSGTSRLMNYGTAFSAQTDNPLYNPTTVSRLTKAGLSGKFLACRIDAPTLAEAKTAIDNAATVAALSELPDSDKLYSDESTYLASLPCQHLRILTAALGTLTNDAFAWGDPGSPSFGTAGSRAAFVDDSSRSAESLRDADPVWTVKIAMFANGYAAGLGQCVLTDTFDIESFLEMLRIGGTLAEAFGVAVEHIDYVAVAVGSPLMTVAFQKAGYNVYRGVGGIENVDFDNPVAYLRKDDTNPTLGDLGHAASTRYTYVVRPVGGPNELRTPDMSCTVEMGTDVAGGWVGSRPAGVEFVAAKAVAAGKIELRWGYRTPYGGTAPADFGIYHSDSSDISTGSPQATESYAGDTIHTKTLSLAGGATYYLAVTARASGGVESHLSEVIGPIVADSLAPAAPDLYVSASF